MAKVLFVISELRGGGAERALSNIVTHLPDDWDIDILLSNIDSVEFPYRGNILSVGMPQFNTGKTSVYLLIELIKRTLILRRLKRKKHYDACISFLDSANISNVLSGNRHCKTIISIRSCAISEEYKWVTRIIFKFLILYVYSRANIIVAVSKEIEEELKHKFPKIWDKVTSIINGVDYYNIEKQILTRPDNQFVFCPNKKCVITIGRLDSAKGQWHLIRSFSEVVKREHNAVLLVLGNGDLKKYLNELTVYYHLEENIIFMGFCENPFWYCAKADVFVLPSMYEGYPNALVEAICCGIPCVATDFHSGAREILAPDLDVLGERVQDITEVEYGILTPVCSGKMYQGGEKLEQSEEMLANALLMLLQDEKKNEYYRSQSEKRKQDLGIERIVDEWIELITE